MSAAIAAIFRLFNSSRPHERPAYVQVWAAPASGLMHPRAEGTELPINAQQRVAVMARLRIEQAVERIGVCLAQLTGQQNRLQTDCQHAKAVLESLIDQAPRRYPQLSAAPLESGFPDGSF